MDKARLTTSTPVWLILLATVCLGLRTIVWAIESSQRGEVTGIKWNEPSKIDLVGRDYQSKLILYYFTSEGLESCKTMNNTSLLNKDIVKLVNEEFLPVKIENKQSEENTDTGKLKKELQQKFVVFTFPTLVVSLPSGKEIETRNAYAGVSAKPLLRFLEHCQRREGYSRGLDYLAHAKYAEAARSFESWLSTAGDGTKDTIDGALYCALSYDMLGDNNKVRVILDKTLQNKRYSKDRKWTEPLAELLLGKLDGEGLIKECDRQGYREPRVYYFIGMLELKHGNVAGAIENLRLTEKGTYTSSEIYGLADGQINVINQVNVGKN